MNAGILYDGTLVSKALLPPILIIMIVSATIMASRIAPQDINTVCSPLVGQVGAILYVINKIIQILVSIILYIVYLWSWSELKQLYKLINDFLELFDALVLIHSLRYICEKYTEIIDNLPSNVQNDEEIIKLKEFLFEEQIEIDRLEDKITERIHDIGKLVRKISYRLEGYDFKEGSGSVKDVAEKATEMIGNPLRN